MPELPQELLEEILCRVPATSLIRLRSTCKQWKRLFNDTRFSKKHYDKAAKQSLVLILTEEYRICSLSLNLHGTPSVEVACELNLIDSYPNSNQVNINKVFHCDGFLLCTIKQDTRIVVWNPCTAQTIWIQTGRNRCYEEGQEFVLGYYQDNKSYDKSYKILSYKKYNSDDRKFEIYDINSDSWTNLNVTLDCKLVSNYGVSLKGKTYWFARDEKEEQLVIFLLRFDYTRERFERLRLPYQCNSYENVSLSVVGEEKLLVLLQHRYTSKREIWTRNKFDDETKEIMWSKLLEVEIVPRRHIFVGISFFVEEEKKVVVFVEKEYCIPQSVTEVSIVGEDNKAIQVDFQCVRILHLVWQVGVSEFLLPFLERKEQLVKSIDKSVRNKFSAVN